MYASLDILSNTRKNGTFLFETNMKLVWVQSAIPCWKCFVWECPALNRINNEIHWIHLSFFFKRTVFGKQFSIPLFCVQLCTMNTRAKLVTAPFVSPHSCCCCCWPCCFNILISFILVSVDNFYTCVKMHCDSLLSFRVYHVQYLMQIYNVLLHISWISVSLCWILLAEPFFRLSFHIIIQFVFFVVCL